MTDIIKCDYLHSDAYRGFVNALVKEGVAVGTGIWWVERGVSIAGSVYHLYQNGAYMGDVRPEDSKSGDVASVALWRLMKYLECFMRYTDWAVLVFPHNWSNTSWYTRSNEFVVMNGVRSKREWGRFLETEFGVKWVVA